MLRSGTQHYFNIVRRFTSVAAMPKKIVLGKRFSPNSSRFRTGHLTKFVLVATKIFRFFSGAGWTVALISGVLTDIIGFGDVFRVLKVLILVVVVANGYSRAGFSGYVGFVYALLLLAFLKQKNRKYYVLLSLNRKNVKKRSKQGS